MFNFVLLIGRTGSDVKVNTVDNGIKVANMTLAVNRSFKNAETGEYDVDFVTVVLWQGIAENVSKHVKKGSTVAVKGRVAVRSNEVNGIKINVMDIIGERVTFINLKNESTEISGEE